MKSFFLTFDLFSQTPSLKINGGTRASTKFGSLIGIFSIIALLSGITFILLKFFGGFDFDVNSFIDNSIKPNIDLSKMKIGIHLLDKRSKEFEEAERIFSIQARLWNFYMPEGNFTIPKVKYQEIKIIKCNEYKKNNLFSYELEQYSKIFKDLYCLDLQNLGNNLTGIYGNLGK